MTKAKRSVIGAYGREPFISAVTDHAHVGDARKRYWRSGGELPPARPCTDFQRCSGSKAKEVGEEPRVVGAGDTGRGGDGERGDDEWSRGEVLSE
jgi:hypothetical protein